MSLYALFSVALLSLTLCSAKIEDGEKHYVAVIDGGSSGTRLYIYSFDQYMQLSKLGNGYEFSSKIEPGLSAYAGEPEEAPRSLIPLLEKAESQIPKELRAKTPLFLGGTGGLRSLPKEKADQIIAAIKEYLGQSSSLEYRPEWVKVIDGSLEGAYIWVSLNYLLGNIGKNYSKTAAVVDLGGASVQMVYALSEEAASDAPNPLNEEEPYVSNEYLNNTQYHIYSHSYLNYGMESTRARVFNANVDRSYSYCINAGYNGIFNHNGKQYNVSASPSGPDFTKCRREIFNVLNTKAACLYKSCTFGGIWSGGGGEGQKDLFLTSNFYYRGNEAGVIETGSPSGKASPLDYKRAAREACSLRYDQVPSRYPTTRKENWPFVCMDLTYHYTLLVHGLGVRPNQQVTVIDKVKYDDAYIEATWALGSAIDILSSKASSSSSSSSSSSLASITAKMLHYWERM